MLKIVFSFKVYYNIINRKRVYENGRKKQTKSRRI